MLLRLNVKLESSYIAFLCRLLQLFRLPRSFCCRFNYFMYRTMRCLLIFTGQMGKAASAGKGESKKTASAPRPKPKVEKKEITVEVDEEDEFEVKRRLQEEEGHVKVPFLQTMKKTRSSSSNASNMRESSCFHIGFESLDSTGSDAHFRPRAVVKGEILRILEALQSQPTFRFHFTQRCLCSHTCLPTTGTRLAMISYRRETMHNMANNKIK